MIYCALTASQSLAVPLLYKACFLRMPCVSCVHHKHFSSMGDRQFKITEFHDGQTALDLASERSKAAAISVLEKAAQVPL
eukprot:m.495614 g.495614  ORF g.495614 m.495614 type:complete len:80 (+) comp21802_c0_seq1:917-1156(+)